MFVKEAIEKHGKCSHKEISQYVATKIDADISDKNFKKAVYNDLDSLLGDNIVGIEYRTRAGELIPIGEEDDYKNKRNSFYFLIGGEEEIDGVGLFKEAGINFIKQFSSVPEWKVSNVKHKDQPLKDVVCLFLKHSDKYLSLETALEDLPASIYFSGKGGFVPTSNEIKSIVNNKTSLIMLPSPYLELPTNDSLGEFYINFFIDDNDVIKAKIGYCNSTSENSIGVINSKKHYEQIQNQIKLINDWVPTFFKENPSLNRCKTTSRYEEFDDYMKLVKKSLLNNQDDLIAEKLLTLENIFLYGSENYLENLKENLFFCEKSMKQSINRSSWRQIEVCENDYYRVNDYIDDAKANEPLCKPSIVDIVDRTNKGNENTLHAKKPPKKTKVKSQAKIVSRMDSTEKYQQWEPLQEKTYSLPFSIKIGYDLEILIADIYANSSFNKKAS